MRTYIQLASLMLFTFIKTNTTAQDIPCSAFCVTDIQLDSLIPELMNVRIFFASNNEDFINYPYISVVTDEQGDTLGTGTLNFFGQFGNSSQDYPVYTDLDSIPMDLHATVVFHYDTSICVLEYPCTTTAVGVFSEQILFEVYPNPVTTNAVVSLMEQNGCDYLSLYNLQGQEVRTISMDDRRIIPFECGDLGGGVYLMVLQSDSGYYARKVIIVD